MKRIIFAFSAWAFIGLSCSMPPKAAFVTTTENEYWVTKPQIEPAKGTGTPDVTIDITNVQQIIEGFGTCFNELGWTSLNRLEPEVREGIMEEMFSPGAGANFVLCRMPVAANDFAIDWYSYNETDGDFAMKDFSIDHDRATLIPFIKKAQQYYPALRVWASPWSPPSWMKYNKHYASRSTAAMARRMANRPRPTGESTYMSRVVDNGLPEDRQGYEGTDMFIQEDAYLKAYALYFSKFIDAYKKEGIDIFAVMPQNEFNSAQIFPSCCWTAAGLTDFIGNYLGPAMEAKGVEVMFGTMERANEALVDTILTDPVGGRYIKGIGFQWAGKNAIPGLHRRYPDMRLYQTEQECGNGRNDWKGAVHSWDLMKHYLNNGVSGYMYWNTSLMQGGVSRWGWAQNSLVVVNEDKTFRYTPEYYVMKHVSHYVLPGARKLIAGGSYEDVLAFVNPNGSIVVIAGNDTNISREVRIRVNGYDYTPVLTAYSLNTLLIH